MVIWICKQDAIGEFKRKEDIKEMGLHPYCTQVGKVAEISTSEMKNQK